MQKRKRRPLSKKEKALYAGVLVGFSIFYFGYYLPYVLSQIPPSNQLLKFSFPDNTWFASGGVTITDRASFFHLPVTNDKLLFEIELTNKHEESLTISPELDIRYGGESVQKIAHDLIILGSRESRNEQIIFYPKNVGLNEVILNAKILNIEDDTTLDTVSGTYYVRVYSQSDVFQSQLNLITNIGIFLSVGVAVFALIPTFVSLRHSRKQLESDLDEKDKTLRAWIGVEGVTLDKVHDSCRLHYHNYGRLPATSASYKFKVSDTPVTFEDIEKENYDTLVSGNIIFPDFDHTALIRVDKGVADEARKGTAGLFIGVLIEYRYNSEKQGKYIGVFEYKSEVEQFRVVDQRIN